MRMDTPTRCPRCKSNYFVKHGKVNNIQRYKCKICGYNFTVNKLGKSTDYFILRRAIQLYLEGFSTRKIEKLLGIGHGTINKWVKKHANGLTKIRRKPNRMNLSIEVNDVWCSINNEMFSFKSGLLLLDFGNKCLIVFNENKK